MNVFNNWALEHVENFEQRKNELRADYLVTCEGYYEATGA